LPLINSGILDWGGGGRIICDVQAKVRTTEAVALEPGAFDIEMVAENLDFV